MCLWMFMDGMIGMYKIWLDIGICMDVFVGG